MVNPSKLPMMRFSTSVGPEWRLNTGAHPVMASMPGRLSAATSYSRFRAVAACGSVRLAQPLKFCRPSTRSSLWPATLPSQLSNRVATEMLVGWKYGMKYMGLPAAFHAS